MHLIVWSGQALPPTVAIEAEDGHQGMRVIRELCVHGKQCTRAQQEPTLEAHLFPIPPPKTTLTAGCAHPKLVP